MAAKKKDTNKVSKEMLMVIGVIVILVAVFIIAYSIFNRMGKIEYRGLTFTEDTFGEIPIYRYTYNFESNGEIINYRFYVRNNPAENNVPIAGEIYFPPKKPVYVAINGSWISSNQTQLAVLGLVQFLSNNQFNVQVGTPDADEANASNGTLPYITCEKYPNNIVIDIRDGWRTQIYKEGQSCHMVEIAKPEHVLLAVEKFEIQAIADAKAAGSK